MPKLLMLCVFTVASIIGYAQTADIFKPDSVRKQLIAVKISTLLRIDGLLNEREWRLAPSSPQFTEIEPVQNAAPQFETEVSVLYNNQNLYIGVFAKDPLGTKALRATNFKRDFDYLSHDLVTITIDGFNDKRNAMCFATNA